MALLKKKSAETPDAADGATPKRGGKLLSLLAPVLVFVAAFGASWLVGGGETAPSAHADAQGSTASGDTAQAADWTAPRPASIYALDPLTITAGAQGQILKIGISVEVWEQDAQLDSPRLRDAFTAYLRALDPQQLSDPSFHMRLKRALLHRARVVAGPDVVADVLITDFLLTS